MSIDHDQRFRDTDTNKTAGTATAQVPATIGACDAEVAQTREFEKVPPVLVRPAPYAPYGGYETPQYQQGPLTGLQMAPDAVARLGLPTATETMSRVTARGVARPLPRRGWRPALYAATWINLGRSPDELYERELYARVRRNVAYHYQIGILGLKGGAGKTSVTVTLGSPLARVRGDRILAVDADPDCGNIAERAGQRPEMSISNLLSDSNLRGYNDL